LQRDKQGGLGMNLRGGAEFQLGLFVSNVRRDVAGAQCWAIEAR
jgi:hypothetical protein